MLCCAQGSSAHKVIAAKQAADAPAPARVGVREQRKLARKARAAPEDGARASGVPACAHGPSLKRQ